MVQADDEANFYDEAEQMPTVALLDPIRIAVQAFVGNVDTTSKQMTGAAERFAQDYAHLIQVAAESRRHAAEERASARGPDHTPDVEQPGEPAVAVTVEPAYQEPETVVDQPMEPVYAQKPEPIMARATDPAVEDLQRSAVAVTQAASMAADAARDAAAGAVGHISAAQAATNEATDRRLQRLEEDIAMLTGLMRELFDHLGTAPVKVGAIASRPKNELNPRISRRFRMRAAREARQNLQAEQRRSA
jgi:hypothetical protein